MINKIFLIGNLTKDPELATTNSGVNYCKFSLAVQRKYTGEDGVKGTDFIPIVAWKGQADLCSKYLKKGSKIAVIGNLQTSSYNTREGAKRYISQVIVEELEFIPTKGQKENEGNDFDRPIPQTKEGVAHQQ